MLGLDLPLAAPWARELSERDVRRQFEFERAFYWGEGDARLREQIELAQARNVCPTRWF
jgi:hypothetical protein